MNGYELEGSQEYEFDASYYFNPEYAIPAGILDVNNPVPHQDIGSMNDDSIEFAAINLDIDLNFISKILMEEEMEDKIYMLEGDPALVAAAEKPFYDILTSSDLPSPDGPPLYTDSFTSPEDSGSNGGQFSDLNNISDSNEFGNLKRGIGGNYVAIDGWTEQHVLYSQIHAAAAAASDHEADSEIHQLISSYAVADESDRDASISFLLDESQPVWQFKKGEEEASRFLPHSSKLIIDAMTDGVSESTRDGGSEVVKAEVAVNGTRGVKNLHHDDFDLDEGRSIKQSAIYYPEEHIPKEMYDEILLCHASMNCEADANAGKSTQREASGNARRATSSTVSNGGKSKGGRKQSNKEVIDLRSLLILCAQSIAADDRLSANEQLKQIRQHSSSTGDGSQRLAHYFADGLEARLAGIGSQIYRSHMAKPRTSAADILKAYRLYMSSCPFKKISHFFANQTILRVTRRATRIHIIDFGIGFGYQWPCLIQSLSSRPHGGSPMLRMTGIDFPQPGFRPIERLEETGRRLADYARDFNVPFEYQPIASKWEDIKIKDLDIREDELLVVSCLHMLKKLADETVTLESPRNTVLNNIKKMNPTVFIHCITNGAYGSPFFVTRFREALFHFSALFDAFDCNMPREDPQRQCLEREFLGKEALNVIACEGTERLHRPETYKQWQVRNQRCGFSQLPLDPEILTICKENILSRYNKDFLIDTDGKWMLLGWKGRVLYATSTWRPTNSGF